MATCKHLRSNIFRLFKQMGICFFLPFVETSQSVSQNDFHAFNKNKMHSMKMLNSAPLPSIPSRRRQGSKLSGHSTRDTCDGIELGQIGRWSRSITKDAPADGTQFHKLKQEMEIGAHQRERFAKLPPIKKPEAEEDSSLNKTLPGNIYAHNYTIKITM